MSEVWTILKILQWTEGYLKERGVEGGRLDAQTLLGEVLGLDRVGLYLQFERPLEREELAVFREMIRRRVRREPVQYILERAEFWSLPLRVTPAVLIPRSDTEVLVEEALRIGSEAESILDIGTGSGAIALALASELPKTRVEGIDISPEALVLAEENARRHNLQDRATFSLGDLRSLPQGPWGLIISNPPYIPTGEIDNLMPEVRDFEPYLALDGGPDGLNAYRLLASQALRRLTEGGWLLVEVGIGQAQAVSELFLQSGLSNPFTRADYAGVARVVGGQKSQTS